MFSSIGSELAGSGTGSGMRRHTVIDYVDNTAAPPTEALNHRYILDDTGASHAGWDGAAALDIVEFDGTVWVAFTPTEGRRVYVDAEDGERVYVDDPAPAWEVRDYPIPEGDVIFIGTGHAHSGGADGKAVAHSSTSGRTVDDHHAQAHEEDHRPGGSDEQTELKSFISAIVETIAVTVTENAGTAYLNLEQSGTGDITVIFSDGHHTHDCTPADQVALTAGTDASPTLNYVYILQSDKTLTVSTTGWPNAEYAPVATVLVQTAASIAADGAYKVHVWTDHIVSLAGNGHISDAYRWIRQQHAGWISGVSQTLTITPGAPDTVIFTTGAGVVQQLHEHTFPAFAGTPDLYVVNDFATAYDKVTDLAVLLTDSANGSMSGRYFSLVIWGSVSESTGDCKLFVNLPTGSYITQAALEADDSKYASYSIPAEFKGTGFLISELKLRHQVAGGGDWTSIDEVDLRGLLPALSAGAGSAVGSEFLDTVFRIQDDGDPTKEIAFQASGIATGNTRTITMPDSDLTLPVGVEDGADVTDFANVLAALGAASSTVDFNSQTITAGILALGGGTPAAGDVLVALGDGSAESFVQLDNSRTVARAIVDVKNIGASNVANRAGVKFVVKDDGENNTTALRLMAGLSTITDTSEVSIVDLAGYYGGSFLTLAGINNGRLCTEYGLLIQGRANVGEAGGDPAAGYVHLWADDSGAPDRLNVTESDSTDHPLMYQTDFDAQTMLVAVSDNTPVAATIADSEFAGRPPGGNVGPMTAAEARTILQTTSYADFFFGPEDFISRTTNGADSGDEELAGNDVMNTVWLFDPGTEEAIQKKFRMPDDWDLGTFKAIIYWDGSAGATGGADDVLWGVSAVAAGNDEAMDQAMGTEVEIIDGLITLGDLHETAATGAVTVGNTPALGNLIWLQVARKAGDASDTMDAEDAKFLGVAIQYGVLAASPSAW